MLSALINPKEWIPRYKGTNLYLFITVSVSYYFLSFARVHSSRYAASRSHGCGACLLMADDVLRSRRHVITCFNNRSAEL